MPPASNTFPQTLNKELMQTMTVTMTNTKRKKRRASGSSNNDDNDDKNKNMCSAVHITYNQNHTECTLPT
jgi:hypothetical protein